MRARGVDIRRALAEHRRSERKPARKSLGGRHDIGCHSVVHIRIELTAPSVAALYLVGDREDAVLFAQPEDAVHEIRVERVDSALSLNAFEHHGAAALFAERFESVEVSGFGIHESPGKRSEFGMEGILSGRGKCRHRSSVEAVFQRYHRGTALVAVFAESKTPCRLDRAFVRLGARIREEHLLHSRALAKHLRKDCARLRIVKVRRMPAGVKLLLHRLDPFAVAHTEGVHGDSRSEVEP